MIRTFCRRSDRGFSLLELMIVVAVTLVVAAVAVPNIMGAIFNARLRSGAGSLAGLLQNARMVAVKQNELMSVHFGSMSSGPIGYIDVNGDGSRQNTEPMVQMGAPVSKVLATTGSVTAIDSTVVGFTPLTSDPSFNPRGLPCSVSGAPPVTTCNVGFVFYFTDSRPLGVSGWSAVTITPAGRVRTWMWDGTKWAN